jgi:hypothetical protein
MKKVMERVFFSLTFLGVFLLFVSTNPSSVLAQNTYSCLYFDATGICQMVGSSCFHGCTGTCQGTDHATCDKSGANCICSATSPENILCEDGSSINTAIGCINASSVSGFVRNTLPWLLGIGGGIAFLLAIYAGFLITTSAGDPKRMSAGKELLTAAIGGLILLGLSVFVLRTIGKDLLNIPGL